LVPAVGAGGGTAGAVAASVPAGVVGVVSAVVVLGGVVASGGVASGMVVGGAVISGAVAALSLVVTCGFAGGWLLDCSSLILSDPVIAKGTTTKPKTNARLSGVLSNNFMFSPSCKISNPVAHSHCNAGAR